MRFVPLKYELGLPAHFEPGINSGKQALEGRFFVARCAIELTGKIKTGDPASLERWPKLRWRRKVVLDRISVANHLNVLESVNRPQHRKLYISRHAR